MRCTVLIGECPILKIVSQSMTHDGISARRTDAAFCSLTFHKCVRVYCEHKLYSHVQLCSREIIASEKWDSHKENLGRTTSTAKPEKVNNFLQISLRWAPMVPRCPFIHWLWGKETSPTVELSFQFLGEDSIHCNFLFQLDLSDDLWFSTLICLLTLSVSAFANKHLLSR